MVNNVSNLKTLKAKIEHCLREDESCRNSDIRLTNLIWWTFYQDKLKVEDEEVYVKLIDLYNLPSQDDIKRIRAHFQNKLKVFLPTDENVRRKRKIKEEDYRKFLGYASNS